MEIIAGPLDWTHIDEQRWAEFLATETGMRLLPRLANSAPQLHGEGDTNKILIRSGELRGYQAAVQELLSMAHETKPEARPSGDYPPLEDDAAWNDGQKLVAPSENQPPTPE